uniref:Acetylserotonin O-methyltransferase n=1 Tax=Saimiri boliviensis boliviensis TaxID=39432 RepID=A0A2K6UCA4_SAIBB
MSSPEDPCYRLLTDYANGFMVSQVVFAACELGVFDVLAEAPGPLAVAAVAAGVGASSHAMERLLDACVSLKLLQVEMRGGEAFYGNTEMSRIYLSRVSPTSQCNMLLYMAKTTYHCWGRLAQAVREGKNQYLQTFGVPADELFSAIYRSEGERVQFMQALRELWSVDGRSVLTAFDLSLFPLVCDLGGDFFKDRLPEADLYILARILHDWADGRCSQLLERVYHSCKPGGGILVIESLLDEDRRGPLLTQLYSLNMLVQTEGQERTPSHYRALLSSAGFRDFQFKKTGLIYDAILARK